MARLDAISIVQAPSFISAVWAIIMVLVSWWLMYRGWTLDNAGGGVWDLGEHGLGLNGFAYASGICFSLQLVTLYLYVFMYRKAHLRPGKEVWFGWQPRRVFGWALNRRFIMLALPMVVQYALNSWTSTIFQMFMSSRSQLLSAAYGVTSTYISTGGSVSNALFMAVSTRVGEVLGEGSVQRAKVRQPPSWPRSWANFKLF
jgi:Na+-driven multidrug efflux pump